MCRRNKFHHVCHDAIYLDRSFQADLYLQSIDRICRLGNNDQKTLHFTECYSSKFKKYKFAIKSNLERKIDYMGQLLNDPNLIKMALDETEGLM